MGVVCAQILFFTLVLPFISSRYDIGREFMLLSAVLSPFFIIGAYIIITKSTSAIQTVFPEKKLSLFKILSPLTVITSLVIINFLFSMGVPHQIAGSTDSLIFNPGGEEYQKLLVHDQDFWGAIWIGEYRQENIEIYSDRFSERVLQSQGGIATSKPIPEIYSGSVFDSGYLFSIYYNNINMVMRNYWYDNSNLAPRAQEMTKGLDKIYSNKAAEIWTI